MYLKMQIWKMVNGNYNKFSFSAEIQTNFQTFLLETLGTCINLKFETLKFQIKYFIV